MTAFLGLDVGTTAIKALAIDDTGNVLAQATRHYGYTQPQPGWVEQDAIQWRRLVVEVVREVTAAIAINVSGLALSTQGDTAVPIDQNSHPLAPARTWMDTRPWAEVEAMRELPEERWHAITGTVPLPHATASSILWWRHHLPRFTSEIRGVYLVQDYLTEWLTGRRLLDAPNASRTLLYDIHDRCWSEELLEFLAISRDLLADTAESGTVVGSLQPDVAVELGLRPETLVVLGGHDQTCAAVGCGVVKPGSLMLSCGTAWVLLAATAHPLTDQGQALHAYCHAISGGYALLGAYAGGNLLDWFCDSYGHGSREERRTSILREAQQAESAGRPPLLFLPHFYGSSLPPACPEARGSWLGLTLAHKPGDLALALLSGVALQTAITVAQIRDLGAPTTDLRMIGGGARSRFWAQLVADALQQPLRLPAVSEAAAYGAAILAGQALGAFPDLSVADMISSLGSQINPRPSTLPAQIPYFRQVSTELTSWWQDLARV